MALGICNTREGKTARGIDVPSCGVVTGGALPPTPNKDTFYLSSGYFKTFENPAKAEAAKAYFLQDGSCADREHVEATYTNIAVCAKIHRTCITAPCPDGPYLTFSSQKEAAAEGASFVKWGGCGDLEGTFEIPAQ